MELIRCAYCGELRDPADLKLGKIIVMQVLCRKKRVVKEIEGWYCKDKPCHSNHQMSKEG